MAAAVRPGFTATQGQATTVGTEVTDAEGEGSVMIETPSRGLGAAAGIPNADAAHDRRAPSVIGPWVELPLPDPTDWQPMVGELHLLDSQPKAVRLQGILSAWRAAERTLQAVPPGSPAWEAAHATFVELRTAYLRIADEPSRR